MAIQRIAVVSSRYPAVDQPYNHMFVHARCRQYLRAGLQVAVFVPSVDTSTYEIDGVSVCRAPADHISRQLGSYDTVMVHLLHLKPDPRVSGEPIYRVLASGVAPVILFLHGVEAQPLRFRRPEEIKPLNPVSVGRWLYHDFWRLPRMAGIVSSLVEGPTPFRVVVPSRWFLEEAERGLGLSLGRCSQIIPNGIDTERFRYNPPRQDNSHDVLSIRPLYRRGKYAVDLALATFEGWDAGLRLKLFGAGPDTEWVRRYVQRVVPSNIDLNIGFLAPDAIPAIHSTSAVYLGVTRLDAQGVSMCEAMASGLPVVSFRIDAIPEFVEHGVSGYLADPFDLGMVRKYLVSLCMDADLRQRFALASRTKMESISIVKTCAAELRLAESLFRN